MLGFDVFYDKNSNSQYIMFQARTQQRIIITKNRSMINQIKEEVERAKNPKALKIRSDDDDPLVQEWLSLRKKQTTTTTTTTIMDDDEDDIASDDTEEEQNTTTTTDEVSYQYYWVQAKTYKEQIHEVVNYFKLVFDADCVMRRCLLCNSMIESIAKELIKSQVFDSVYNENEEFWKCSGCKRIYWGKNDTFEHVNFKMAKQWASIYSYHDEASK